MVTLEPKLLAIEHACRLAKLQKAPWADFWSIYRDQFLRLVGPVARCPLLRADEHWCNAYGHLCDIWARSLKADAAFRVSVSKMAATAQSSPRKDKHSSTVHAQKKVSP
jgi:hypothetical protein